MEYHLVRIERMKALIKAIAELEIMLNTFKNNESGFIQIREIYEELINIKKDYFD